MKLKKENCGDKGPWIFKVWKITLKGKRKGVCMEVWRAEGKRGNLGKIIGKYKSQLNININVIVFVCIRVYMMIHTLST